MYSQAIQSGIVVNPLTLNDSSPYHFTLLDHGSSYDGDISLNEGETAGKTDYLQEIVLINQSISVLVVDRECYLEGCSCAHVDELIDAALGLTIRDEFAVRKEEVNFQLF